MVISGSVFNVVFRNEENGYTVLDFDADNTLITVVGIFPTVREGELLTLVGNYRENFKYGQQFEVTEVTFDAPTDLNGILAYLSSGAVRWVGEKLAEEIVAHFGMRTLDVLEHEPERLREIKGVGKKKCKEIAKSFSEQNLQRTAVLYLQNHGIPIGQAIRIFRAYQEDTVKIMEENPYRLVSEVEGFGFLTADRIAEKMGIAKDSEFRFIAGLTYVLQESAAKSGHTYLPQEILCAEAKKTLGTEDDEKIDRCIRSMLITGKLFPFQGEYGLGYTLSINYRTENGIAGKLIKLIDSVKKLDLDAEEEVRHYEEQFGVSFHQKQKDAVLTAVREGVMVITGGPGTGKTTIIRCIVGMMEARGLDVSLAAPTGRAAKRMSEATGREAKTIHRLLGVQSDEKSGARFKYNELHPLETDVVILDEISMADIFIFHSLLSALPSGARLILVGDKDQLPSVSCGNILRDVLACGMLPAVQLTEIYRQDADSLIVENAHRINRGEMPVINNKSSDFFVIQKEGRWIHEEVLTLMTKRLPKFLNVNPEEIQVLCPMKKGVAGVENMNLGLQNALNGNLKRIKIGEIEFREGDKVMHVQNNYDLKWRRYESGEEGEGVFNGDIGTVSEIRKNELDVAFEDGRVATYRNRTEQEQLRLAYAVSVHKSQGSEFKAVIVAVAGGPYQIINRNLLYTAVTRAKNAVVLVGKIEDIKRMVENNYTARRYTMLKELLCENRRKADTLTGLS